MARRKNITRRKIILNSSFRLIRQHGLSGVSLQMIADEAGISKSLLQSYYPHKTELINDILHNIMSTILNKLNSFGIATANEYTAMAVFLDSILELGVRDKGLYNVLDSIFGNTETLDNWVMLIIKWMKDEGLQEAFGSDNDVKVGLTFIVAGGASLYTKRDSFNTSAEDVAEFMVNSFLSTFMGFTREQISSTLNEAQSFIQKIDIESVQDAIDNMFNPDEEVIA